MAILNFGSINVDIVFEVSHIPSPGETISALRTAKGAGGKGLNQSIAIARAGGNVRHFGAINGVDGWLLTEAQTAGVDTKLVLVRDNEPTGQALIMLSADGENAIVLLAGANCGFQDDEIDVALHGMSEGDWLLVQNETNGAGHAVKLARKAGLKIALAAAPFSADAVVPLLSQIDLLALNQIEFDQLIKAVGSDAVSRLPAILITNGAAGACYREGPIVESFAGYRVEALDTTAAGDTFLGYFLNALDQRLPTTQALEQAMAAAALKVTRRGAACAIPTASEVADFRICNMSPPAEG